MLKLSINEPTFDTGLVGSDCGALDTNVVFLDSLGSINRHLVIGLVSVRQAQVVVLNVNVQIRQDELF